MQTKYFYFDIWPTMFGQAEALTVTEYIADWHTGSWVYVKWKLCYWAFLPASIPSSSFVRLCKVGTSWNHIRDYKTWETAGRNTEVLLYNSTLHNKRKRSSHILWVDIIRQANNAQRQETESRELYHAIYTYQHREQNAIAVSLQLFINYCS